MMDRTPASSRPFIKIYEFLYEEYAIYNFLSYCIFHVMIFIHASEIIPEGRKRVLFGIFSKYLPTSGSKFIIRIIMRIYAH